MNQIHQAIYDKVVQPAIRNIPGPSKAWVIEYNMETNRATIEMNSPLSDGRVRHYHVPVMHMGGLSRSGPFRGQEVMVLFVGSYTRPIIIADIDLSYSSNTRQSQSHRRKGGWLPDNVCYRAGELTNTAAEISSEGMIL